jgi:hypothetical protein
MITLRSGHNFFAQKTNETKITNPVSIGLSKSKNIKPFFEQTRLVFKFLETIKKSELQELQAAKSFIQRSWQ